MTTYQDTVSLEKNPAITEKQHLTHWMMFQGTAFGLMLGIMSRAAWDQGIISFIALALKALGVTIWVMLRDLGIAIWIMLQDFAVGCWDFFQFISR